jgi:hypothetical protein
MSKRWSGTFQFEGSDPVSKDKVYMDVDITNGGRCFMMNRRRSVPKSSDAGMERMWGSVHFENDRIRFRVRKISWIVMSWNGSESGTRNYDEENEEDSSAYGTRLVLEARIINEFDCIEIEGMRLKRVRSKL